MFVACFVGEHKGVEYTLCTDGETKTKLIEHARCMARSFGIYRKVKWKCLWMCGRAIRKKQNQGSG